MAVEGVRLPFPEAETFFRQKVNLPTQRWDDLRHGAHVRAFSVAGVVRDDMLADFRSALEKAQADGTGFQAFKASFNEIVTRTGWQFNAPGSTEDQRRDWRARVIFNTNMRVSYMAGRFAQLMDPDVLKYRPFWRYRHNDSRHPRPLHVSWDGLVLSAGDPWWKVHFPPNGWGCLCDVVALNKRQLGALGKDGPDQAPPGGSYQARDPRTGQPETRWTGVDRGWEYNPGEEWMAGSVPSELQVPLAAPEPAAAPIVPPADQVPAATPAQPPVLARPQPPLPPLPTPVAVPASRLMAPGLPETDYVSAFLEEFGATLDQGTAFRDPSGTVIAIDKALFEQRTPDGTIIGFKAAKRDRGRYVRLLADAIREPDEIWVDWIQVALGFVLRRAYIRRVVLPDGRTLFVRFEWSRRGWVGVTAFDTTETYAAKLRTGALLYRRKS